MKPIHIKTICEALAATTEVPGVIHEIASGEIDCESGVAEGDPDDIENFLGFLTDLAINASEEIDDWLRKKTATEDVLQSLADLIEDYEYICDSVQITNDQLQKEAGRLIERVRNAYKIIKENPGYVGDPRRDFYVYTHSDPTTNIVFYVGKGTGRRAWSKDREKEWCARVDALNGQYQINIVADGLTESQALQQEEELMLALGDQLVNRQRPIGFVFPVIDEP